MDALLAARDAGATGRIRRLHVGGIAYNAVQCSVVLACVPAVFTPAG